MRHRSTYALISGAVLALTVLAAPSQARAEWGAVVIGQSGVGGETAFADAFRMTSSLSRGGGREVLMLRDMTLAQIRGALGAVSNQPSLILYVAGPATREGALALRNGALHLSEITQLLEDAGVKDIALLIENCAYNRDQAHDFALPELRSANAIIAASAASGQSCPAAGNRLSDRLSRAGSDATLQVALAGLILHDDGVAPVPVVQSGRGGGAPDASAPNAWSSGDDTVLITPVARNRMSGGIVQIRPTVGAAAGIPVTAPSGDNAAIVTEASFAPSGAGLGVLPLRPGMPEPSLLIGFPEPTLASFDMVVDSPEATMTDLSLDTLEARSALRDADFELFTNLVEGGAFDPPSGEIARALQTALARSECYSMVIDGIWGAGSRRAVENYFSNHPNETAVSLQAELPLYRQMLLLGDVVCEAPAPAPTATAAPRATTQQQPRAQSAPAQQQAPRPQATAPAPPTQPSTPPRRTLGTGVFR